VNYKRNSFCTYNIIALLVLSAIIISCEQGKIATISSDEVKDMPSEHIDSLVIISSDNKGEMRYRIVAKVANKYRFVDTPYYNFPCGLYSSSFTNGMLEADIVADSAVMRTNPDFFTAYGNVVVRNLLKNTRMETQGPLYWDATQKTIYTSVYAIVYTPTDTFPAHKGLITDDHFRNPVFYGVREGLVYREFTATRDSTATTAATDSTVKEKSPVEKLPVEKASVEKAPVEKAVEENTVKKKMAPDNDRRRFLVPGKLPIKQAPLKKDSLLRPEL
jgi:lipopolysaccharide export system protein LptC